MIVRRTIAYLLDALILSIFYSLWGTITDDAWEVVLFRNAYAHIVIDPLGILATLMAMFFYYSLLESSSYKATLGKRIMGLQVVNDEQGPLNLNQALIRNLMKVWAVQPLINLLFVMFRSDRRAVHDVVAGSTVVRSAWRQNGVQEAR